ITGAEALIRWNHPDRGIVSPAEFIHIAEKTGLIVPIGEWVLRTACQQLKRWNDDGISPFTMAINLSSRQFKQETFFNKTIEIFHEAEVDTNSMELELTESILIEDTSKIFNFLNAFKAFGIHFSLDDFGTGYSSLSYLKHFPISKLKIDQSFVKNITINGSDSTLVKAIIAMGSALNLTTIAEGVESQEQFDFLRQEGCDEIQGYLLGKPMSASQFEAFVYKENLQRI
ncbi:EAL domain-containing protein, partial [Sulfuricurvum sp.]|uniref:putative bifunctional diguanylate cyclase/phosphodiesterase n=1 Tax=Sulfuricurvum sp. TaxID=2025608 RepID=UPI00260C1390